MEGNDAILLAILTLVFVSGAGIGAMIVHDYYVPPIIPQPRVTVETATPQTEPKAYSLVPIRDDGEWCMGRIYTTEPLPLEDSGFMAPFELLDLEKNYAGSGYKYFFRASPLWNCSNVRQNIEAATR